MLSLTILLDQLKYFRGQHSRPWWSTSVRISLQNHLQHESYLREVYNIQVQSRYISNQVPKKFICGFSRWVSSDNVEKSYDNKKVIWLFYCHMLFSDSVGSSRHCRKKAYVGKSHMTIKKSYDFFIVIWFFPTMSEVPDTVEKNIVGESHMTSKK